MILDYIYKILVIFIAVLLGALSRIICCDICCYVICHTWVFVLCFFFFFFGFCILDFVFFYTACYAICHTEVFALGFLHLGFCKKIEVSSHCENFALPSLRAQLVARGNIFCLYYRIDCHAHSVRSQ
ncbi:hypothetical protein [Helicobacter sp. T3_23-1059]